MHYAASIAADQMSLANACERTNTTGILPPHRGMNSNNRSLLLVWAELGTQVVWESGNYRSQRVRCKASWKSVGSWPSNFQHSTGMRLDGLLGTVAKLCPSK